MPLSVLSLFILSVLERGLESPYDLHREAGVSLGASLPALKRLLRDGLVTRTKAKNATRRPRHCFKLTARGGEILTSQWPRLLDQPPLEIESVLRVVDMALHYRTDEKLIKRFLKDAAARRKSLASQAELSGKTNVRGTGRLRYISLQARCDAARLRAEAEVLLELARKLEAGNDERRAVQQSFEIPPS